MPRALILGGTGAIGRRLLVAGWTVELTGRDPARFPSALSARGVCFTVSDRRGPTPARPR